MYFKTILHFQYVEIHLQSLWNLSKTNNIESLNIKHKILYNNANHTIGVELLAVAPSIACGLIAGVTELDFNLKNIILETIQ